MCLPSPVRLMRSIKRTSLVIFVREPTECAALESNCIDHKSNLL